MDFRDKSKFKDIVCLACLHDKKLELDLADEFEVSQTTVRRWSTGIAKPHLTLQKLITASIRRRQIKAARLALLTHFRGEVWLKEVSIGDSGGVGALLVQVSDQAYLPKVPTWFEGVPIVTKVVAE
jgi:hypothetical protein